jgi:hypothetical protein
MKIQVLISAIKKAPLQLLEERPSQKPIYQRAEAVANLCLCFDFQIT